MSFHDPGRNQLQVTIPSAQTTSLTTFYQLQVTVDTTHQWVVQHRYSDFVQLHSQLLANKLISAADEQLQLPPKKLLGNRDPAFVERRRQQLQQYVERLLSQLVLDLPVCVADFLSMSVYDSGWMLRRLATVCVAHETAIIEQQRCLELTPLPLRALCRLVDEDRFDSFFPDRKVLDKVQQTLCIVSRATHVRLTGSWTHLPSSNIQPNSGLISLALLVGVCHLTIAEVPVANIRGLFAMRQRLRSLTLNGAGVRRLSQILLDADPPERQSSSAGDSTSEEDQDSAAAGHMKDADVESDCRNIVWPNLSYLCLSDNYISFVDSAVLVAPNLATLNLSSNSVTRLHPCVAELSSLRRLDLSNNRLKDTHQLVASLPVGICDVQLSGNQLKSPTCDCQSVSSFSRLRSLSRLDLSFNKLVSVDKLVQQLQQLPQLSELNLIGNPAHLAAGPDYRADMLQLLSAGRDGRLTLDSEHSTSDELFRVAIRHALAVSARVEMSGEDGDLVTAAKVPLFLQRAWKQHAISIL